MQRVKFWDALKLFAIFTVVWRHAIAWLNSAQAGNGIRRPRLIYTLFCCIFGILATSAFSVEGLTVNHLTNPNGIDAPNLIMGWKLNSNDRDVRQSSYEINIYSDKAKTNRIWSSGEIQSDESCNVFLTDLPLQPEHNYYWNVTVGDNKGRTATSQQDARFSTGLMGQWDGAQLLSLGENWTSSERPVYKVEAEVTIIDGSPALIFGWTATRAYFMWQIICDQGDRPILRRSIRTFSDDYWQQDVPISIFSKSQLVGQPHKWRIEAKGSQIVTYLGEVQIDKFTNPIRRVPIGQIGMRTEANSKDEALFDNLSVSISYPNGKTANILTEDFSSQASKYFQNAEIVSINNDYKCHVKATDQEQKVVEQATEAAYFYHNFNITKKVASAVWYTTAIGMYDLYVNNSRVGHLINGDYEYEEFKPGWTDYHQRLQYSAHDITSKLKIGNNDIGCVVTSGWAKSQISKWKYNDLSLAFIGKLAITYADGTSETIVTDTDWKCTKYGPIKKGDIYHGEFYDATCLWPWDENNDIEPNVPLTYQYKGTIVPFMGQYVKALNAADFHPASHYVYDKVNPGKDFGSVNIVSKSTDISSFKLKKGETAIFDFGQNFTAVPQISAKGKSGCKMHIRFAEMLNDSGLLDRGNDGPEGSLYLANLRSAKAEIYYVFNGDTKSEQYRPTTTFFGFRYCEITANDDIEILSVVAVPLSASHTDIGQVRTDHELVNKLISNIRWGQKSNMISVPMDCPQRDERQGWTGDAQIFLNTALYNCQLTEFYHKWLQDIRDAQREDGAYCDLAPLSLDLYGNSGYADAGVIIPWNLYLMTADKQLLEEHYPSMIKYMDWLSTQSANSIKYPGAGISYGDWLSYVPTDKRYISQAYYAYVAELMGKISKVLSERDNDSYSQKAIQYQSLCNSIKQEMQSLYFDENGLKKPTQTACVLALKFNLYNDKNQCEKIKSQLSEAITSNSNLLSTGFTGTGYINPALSDYGLSDFAYELLLQRNNPSWLYSVEQGATTMWERWNSYSKAEGFGDASMNSFNHYAFGSVGEWMYRNMAGIKADENSPGFKNIILSPCLDLRKGKGSDRINHVEASYESNYGNIESEWTLDNRGDLTYRVKVPANSTAKVRIPAQDSAVNVYEGESLASEAEGIAYTGYKNGAQEYEIKSGEYVFYVKGISANPADVKIAQNVLVYPNPTKDWVKVEVAEDEHINEMILFNANGIILRKLEASNTLIDFSMYKQGLYFLTIKTDKGASTHRIIKQ